MAGAAQAFDGLKKDSKFAARSQEFIAVHM
jgi:hypothetical protein